MTWTPAARGLVNLCSVSWEDIFPGIHHLPLALCLRQVGLGSLKLADLSPAWAYGGCSGPLSHTSLGKVSQR